MQDKLQPVALGNSDRLRVGQQVTFTNGNFLTFNDLSGASIFCCLKKFSSDCQTVVGPLYWQSIWI